jgi:Lrp/AsnC family transcriptional regulator for asnA, asnC and gidA
MINVKTGYEKSVQTELLEIDEIEESFMVYGVYDMIVKIEVDDMDKINYVVGRKIRIISNVHSTLTLIVAGT